MPSTKGLEKLVRKKKLTNDEWLEMIEARRELIKPHLNSFTLPELGKLECVKSEGHHLHNLYLDLGCESEGKFSLKTQGIFRLQPYQAVEKFPDTGHRPGPGGCPVPNSLKKVWGLTRAGQWLLVTIHCIGIPGYKGRGREQAVHIEFLESDLRNIVKLAKVKPQDILHELGDVICKFAEQRERLYEHAHNLAQMIRIEELALRLIDREEG